MNLIDLLVWSLLALFIIKGLMKGLIREVCSLLGLLAGFWAAFTYDHYLAGAIRALIHLPAGVTIAISFILILATVGALFFFLGHLLTIIFKLMLLGWVNRIGGGFLGLLEGALVLSIVCYLGTIGPLPATMKGYLMRSGSARPFVSSGREIVSGWEILARKDVPAATAPSHK